MPVIVGHFGARSPVGAPANRRCSDRPLHVDIDGQFGRARGAVVREPNETAREKGPTRDPAIEKACSSDSHQSTLSLQAAGPEDTSIVVHCSARHSGTAAVDEETGDQRRGEIKERDG